VGDEQADRRCTSRQDHGLESALDHELIAASRQALESAERVQASFAVRNIHRSVGTMLGYEVTRRHGGAGLPDGTIDITLTGSAGQSFGAFVPNGITLRLVGDANDYFGKGLSGGHLVLRPHEASPSPAERQVIAGNVVLYGATSGEAFISGQVGERFCVRNSGATAVVEGVGDHACEYMTGGSVLVLGPTGRNFAAGMSGGVAYVYDPDGLLDRRCNLDMVTLEALDAEDGRLVGDLLRRHAELTGSALAARLVAAPSSLQAMRKVMPIDYRRVLEATRLAIETGRAVDEAIMAAAHG
jgi:glutamate synthase domain-containing protein 3